MFIFWSFYTSWTRQGNLPLSAPLLIFLPFPYPPTHPPTHFHYSRSDVYRDEDDIFNDLEREDDDQMTAIREKRMNQLKQEWVPIPCIPLLILLIRTYISTCLPALRMEHLKDMRLNSHGSYEDIKSEKDVLQITTGTSHCLVHFYHKEFRRCNIMDKHLEVQWWWCWVGLGAEGKALPAGRFMLLRLFDHHYQHHRRPHFCATITTSHRTPILHIHFILHSHLLNYSISRPFLDIGYKAL